MKNILNQMEIKDKEINEIKEQKKKLSMKLAFLNSQENMYIQDKRDIQSDFLESKSNQIITDKEFQEFKQLDIVSAADFIESTSKGEKYEIVSKTKERYYFFVK